MTDPEIRAKLAMYLASKLTKQQFQEWFAVAAWEIDQSLDEALKQLVYTIELAFAENQSGHLPDDELKKELALLASPQVLGVPSLSVTGASSAA